MCLLIMSITTYLPKANERASPKGLPIYGNGRGGRLWPISPTLYTFATRTSLHEATTSHMQIKTMLLSTTARHEDSFNLQATGAAYIRPILNTMEMMNLCRPILKTSSVSPLLIPPSAVHVLISPVNTTEASGIVSSPKQNYC